MNDQLRLLKDEEAHPARIRGWNDHRRLQIMESLFSKRIIRDLNKFDIQPDPKHVEHVLFENGSLFIHGDAGAGKTLYACSLLLEVEKQRMIIGPKRPMIENPVEFITMGDLFQALRNSFQEDHEGPTEYEIIKKYSNAGILLLDDLCSGAKNSDWALTILDNIINSRYEQLLSTIVTANFPLSKMGQMLGDRITSRIIGMCDGMFVHFAGNDKRIKKG